MIRAVDRDGARSVRILLAVGLVINFAGFVYDWAWHSWNLSLETIPPSKLLVVHGAIYLGSLIVAVAVGQGLSRRVFSAWPERIGLLVVAAGLLLEFLGDVTDMWAHSQGYEKDLYHDFVYNGAGLTLLGYLVIELFQVFRGDADDTDPADDTGRTGAGDPVGATAVADDATVAAGDDEPARVETTAGRSTHR